MSIHAKPGVSDGCYRYYFRLGGRQYAGTTGKTDRREAERHELALRRELKAVNSVAAAFQMRQEQLAKVVPITLKAAWKRFKAHPHTNSSPARFTKCRSFWADFETYMKDNFPEVKTLGTVLPEHAEAWTAFLREHGRWNKCHPSAVEKLSASTMNNFLKTTKRVFSLLGQDAGLVENPFKSIKLLAVRGNSPSAKTCATRAAFSVPQLTTIGEQARHTDWLYFLFMVGMCTGLRKGDICTLRREEVDFISRSITKKTSKTGQTVVIPMSVPGLYEYLAGVPGQSQYFMPALAKTYRRTGGEQKLSREITSFLERPKKKGGCNIRTTRRLPGRTTPAKILDIHSLRHTFIYLAGMNGIPLVVVQNVVGHMDPEMTKMYMDHADMRIKQQMFGRIPNHLLAQPFADLPATRADMTGELRRMTADTWEAIRNRLLKRLEVAGERQ